VDPQVAYTGVRATRGKITRAEPVAALYEQGKIFHIQSFSKLEGQMLTYTGRPTTQSPDRLDALVWALTDLLLGDKKNDKPSLLSPQKIWML
jgi:phage terminase large subunit-like protein